MALLRLLGRLVNLFAEIADRGAYKDLDRLLELYEYMDDQQLRTELNRIIADPSANKAVHRWRWLSRFQDSPTLRALAIAIRLFDRHPCDLPPDSTAYREQKMAALMLIERMNVQMDTGEGKTYAIALASVALLAENPQVIVITANDYLAQRDRVRIGGFMEAAGLSCMHGLPDETFRG